MRRNISVETKIDVVLRIKRGEKIARVAREYGVSRPIIYLWKNEVEQILREGLKPKKSGPKEKVKKKDIRDREIEKLKKELEKLNKEKEELFKKLQKEEKPIKKCPFCSSEKVYKNGTVEGGVKDLIVLLKRGGKRKIRIQRWNCYSCGKRIYPNKKTFRSGLCVMR